MHTGNQFLFRRQEQWRHLRELIDSLLAQHPGGVEITWRPIERKRSLSQNDMWHGIVREIHRFILANTDLGGMTLEFGELRDAIKDGFAPPKTINIAGTEVRLHLKTAKMSPKQMADLIDYTLAWAAHRNIPVKIPGDNGSRAA